MSCPFNVTKKNKLDKALEVFQGDAKSIRIDPNNHRATIRWGNEFKVKSREQAYNMVKSNMARVQKWSLNEFNKSYDEWVTIDGQDNNRITVKINFPKSLERSYIRNLAKEGDYESIEKIRKNPEYYGQQTSPQSLPPKMYQLGNNNKPVIKALDNLVRDVMLRNGVKIKGESEEFKRIFKAKTGKEFTAVAYADIVNNLIHFSDDNSLSGDTLLEEAMHFVVHYLWDSGRLDAIKDTKNGTRRWLETTPEWAQHYEQYRQLYEVENSEPDWEKWVDQEIVTKVITNHVYEKYKNGGNFTATTWIGKRIQGFVNWLMSIWQRKNTDGTYQVNIPLAVENELKGIGEDFINNALSLPTANRTITDPKLITLEAESIDPLIAATNRVVKQQERNILKISNDMLSLYNRQHKRRKDSLQLKYNINDVDELEKNIQKLLSSQELAPLTYDEKLELEELYRLGELFRRDDDDQKIVKELKELSKRKEILKEALREKKYQQGVFKLLKGDLVPVPGIEENAYRQSLKSQAVDLIRELDKVFAEQGGYVDGQKGESRVLLYPIAMKGKNFIESFKPFMDELQILLDTKTTNVLLNDLTPAQAIEFKELVKDTRLAFGQLEDNLNAKWRDSIKKEIIKAAAKLAPLLNLSERDISNLANTPEFDIWNILTANFLSPVDMAPTAIQVALSTQVAVANRVTRIVDEKFTEYSNLLRKHEKALNSNPTIQKYLKKYGLRLPEQLNMEIGKNNIPSGYSLGKYNMHRWMTSRKQEENRIHDYIEKHVLDNYGYKLNIPRGSSVADEQARAELLHKDTNSMLAPEDRKNNHNPILEEYNKQWSVWNKANTQPHPNMEDIVKSMQRDLTDLEFARWWEDNHTVYTDKFGRVQEYSAGELVVPKDKYSDDTYEELLSIPEFKEIHEKYLSLKDEADNSFPSYTTSSYEFRRRVPQISNDNYDMFSRVSRLWKTDSPIGDRVRELTSIFRERIGDAYKNRIDDKIDAGVMQQTIDGQLAPIYTPPIRFTGKLENNESLSLDINGNLALYLEMAINYREAASAIPFFEAIKESVIRSDFKVGAKIGIDKTAKENKASLIEGKVSATLRVVDNLIQDRIYGQHTKHIKIKKVDVTKGLNFTAKVIRDTNLKSNFIAMAMGGMSADVEAAAEVITGRNIPLESALLAGREFDKHLWAITKDFERDLKTNKYTMIMKRIALIDPQSEVNKDSDKVKLINKIAKTANYGIWRLFDYPMRLKVMIGVMDNYRFIDDRWHTRETYLSIHENTPEMWSSHRDKSFLNKVNIVDGKLVADKQIRSVDWDFVTNRSKITASRISYQKTDIDKSIADTWAIAPLVFMHKGYLTLGLQRYLKPKVTSFVTQQTTQGIYDHAFDLAVRRNSGAHLGHLFGQNMQSLSPSQKESVQRIWWTLGWASVAWVLFALSHGDFDDDEKDPQKQFIAYLFSRFLQERLTWTSPGDFWQMLKKPIAATDRFAGFIPNIPFLLEDDRKLNKDRYDMPWERYYVENFQGGKFYQTFPFDTPISNSSNFSYERDKRLINGSNAALQWNLALPWTWPITLKLAEILGLRDDHDKFEPLVKKK